VKKGLDPPGGRSPERRIDCARRAGCRLSGFAKVSASASGLVPRLKAPENAKRLRQRKAMIHDRATLQGLVSHLFVALIIVINGTLFLIFNSPATDQFSGPG